MKINIFHRGYSLIEVLVAVAILMLAVVAPMTIVVKSIQSSQYALEQNAAVFLAQEALSIVEARRNSRILSKLAEDKSPAWVNVNIDFAACEDSTGCGIDAINPYNLSMSNGNVLSCADIEACRLYLSDDNNQRSVYQLKKEGEQTPYTRVMYWNFIDHDGDGANDEQMITVEVEWDSHFLNKKQKVSITSSYFNQYQDLSGI